MLSMCKVVSKPKIVFLKRNSEIPCKWQTSYINKQEKNAFYKSKYTVVTGKGKTPELLLFLS